jgi:competence protein ComEC
LEGKDPSEPPFLVQFLDVGQGDACLLKTPAGHFYLYDTGNQDAKLLSSLHHAGVDTLSAVFISHQDFDHYGSFLPLLHEFPIKKVYLPAGTSQNRAWQNVLATLDVYSGQRETLLAGDTLILDDNVHVRALWPYSPVGLESNNRSLVIRVEYAGHAILLTGDVEDEGERGILASSSHLASDILKVAHHGSRTSNGLPFISAVDPRWAVISCDSSVYGHPHAEALADLNYIIGDSSRILRTDKVGTVVFALDPIGVRRIVQRGLD